MLVLEGRSGLVMRSRAVDLSGSSSSAPHQSSLFLSSLCTPNRVGSPRYIRYAARTLLRRACLTVSFASVILLVW